MAGHTGPRTKCNVLRYHIGRFNELFTFTGGAWVYHGELVTPAIASDLGDMLGGMNSADQAQYPGQPFPTDPDSGGGTQPPATGPADWPIEMQPKMWGGERRSGEGGVPKANPRVVTCVPITIPLGSYEYPTLTMSVAEYGSPASTKQATLSREPGDFSANALAFSQGNTAAPSIAVGMQVEPGDTIYFNFRFWSSDLNGPSTDDKPQGVTYSGGWPR